MMLTRLERLAKIEKLLLQHPEGLNIREIAGELGIERNTVHRDITFLSESLRLWENKYGRIGIFQMIDISIENLIQLGESNRLEFKQTACWNEHRQIKDQSLAENIIKAMVGFMNSHLEGLILIGVSNKGEVVGIDNDLRVADTEKQNKDGFELFLRNTINSCVRSSAIPYYDIDFVEAKNKKDVCKITILPAPHPTYFKGAFYVRNGNQTKLFSTQDAVDYIKDKWGRN